MATNKGKTTDLFFLPSSFLLLDLGLEIRGPSPGWKKFRIRYKLHESATLRHSLDASLICKL